MRYNHTPPSNNRFNYLLRLAIGFMILWVIADYYGLFNSLLINQKIELHPVTPPQGNLGADERSNIEIFKTVSPSVVYITNKRLQRSFFSFAVTEIPQGTGSGFLWDNNGHIVTNFHVIYKAHEIEVKLQNGQIHEATLVGADPDHDLAVLQISPQYIDIQPVMIGRSAELQVGQKVLAIGNPFGLDSTLTTGVISAIGRTIMSMTERYIHDVIQTDAAINPGNSGGPLLDSFGRIIGINTSIISTTGSNAGIGFAVPIDTVNRIITQLINYGNVPRPGIGISLIPDRILSEWGMEGAGILQVNKGGAAERAGLKGVRRLSNGELDVGDIIIECDHHPVKKMSDLISALDRHKVGDEIELIFLRDNIRMQTRLVLQKID